MPRPTLSPILDEDLTEFSSFLQQNFGSRTTAEWRAAFQQDWCTDKPNNGFMLRDEGRLVGVIGAIYATRLVRGELERFCNITSWYVLPEFRTQSMRLATVLTAQPGYHFTDFTPTRLVTDSLKFLKFQPLDARQIFVPNWPGFGHAFGPTRIIDDPEAMRSVLDESQAKVLRDHLHLPWLRQAVIADPRGPVHVVFKPLTFKHHACAFVLAVNDRDGFTRNLGRFGQYLLFKHRLLSMRFERRFLTQAPLTAVALKRFPRKLYYSPTLREQDIDNLYSEVAAIDLPARYL